MTRQTIPQAQYTFTPGPWRVTGTDFNFARHVIILGPGNVRIAFANANKSRVANANLIAAAPVLYDALMMTAIYIDDIHGDSKRCPALMIARDAIATADGLYGKLDMPEHSTE